MQTRIRWEGKVRICEYKRFFKWKEAARDDFSNRPSGFPAYPPFGIELLGLFRPTLLDFPWQPGDKSTMNTGGYLSRDETGIVERKAAVFNPHNKPIDELPTIYGLNNGGSPNFWHGLLIAEDGTALGGHLCTNEVYMLHDLGILEGTRPDRHETFRKHYPDGYRMEFVSYNYVKGHEKLQATFKKYLTDTKLNTPRFADIHTSTL